MHVAVVLFLFAKSLEAQLTFSSNLNIVFHIHARIYRRNKKRRNTCGKSAEEEEIGEEYASDLQSVLMMVHSPQRYPLFTTTFIVDY